MLAALLLAGLATAAFIPMMADALSDDDDLPADAPDQPEGGKADLLTESAVAGALYDIPAAPSQTVLNSFDASQDRCVLHADDWDTEFTVEKSDDGGVTIGYATAEGPVSICFSGFSELPVDAIDVVTHAPGDPDPIVLPLVAVLESEGDGESEEAPLAPTDPDAPDSAEPGTGDAVALDPVDSDQPDTPDATPVTAEVLSPVEDPDPTAPTNLPNIGWIYPDPAGGKAAPPVIDGFSTSDDVLSVTLTPDAVQGPLEVAITPSEDGRDGIVTVGGQPVAILKGTPDASPSQVHVELSGKVTL